MRITFNGAAGEVAGSSYLVETDRARVVIDFGMFQVSGEADRKNRRPDPKNPRRLDAVVLTHAHLDHCGRLPLLVPRGYRGVWAFSWWCATPRMAARIIPPEVGDLTIKCNGLGNSRQRRRDSKVSPLGCNPLSPGGLDGLAATRAIPIDHAICAGGPSVPDRIVTMCGRRRSARLRACS